MTTIAAARPGRRPKPMNPWRLEWLRLTRTPRTIALAGVYLFFGLLGPVTAKYLQEHRQPRPVRRSGHRRHPHPQRRHR